MINVITRGSGRKLLLIHGLGGSWESWSSILDGLSAHREIIAIDLPGHGGSPSRPDSGTFLGLVTCVESYIRRNDLTGIDVTGSSMGARIALELARRGIVGNVIALDPGGFWKGWERTWFRVTIGASVRLLRALRPVLTPLSRNALTRTLLLVQLSARPWKLKWQLVASELKRFADTHTFDALVKDLATGPEQTGPAAACTGKVTIVWGRLDRLCFPRQARRAKEIFPTAELHWLCRCGHFPMWDRPRETIAIILAGTASRSID